MKTMNLSGIVRTIYDKYVPEEKKREIFDRKKASFNLTGTTIRVQPYIPKELYAILESFGAFSSSESEFFTARSIEYIERRAAEMGLLNVILQSVATGGR